MNQPQANQSSAYTRPVTVMGMVSVVTVVITKMGVT
jgi:hypothetical protein